MWTAWVRDAIERAARPPAVPRLKVCDRYADVPLRTQFGDRVRFREAFVADGRAVVVNTMYTTCRGTCPTTGATLRELREALSPVFGGRLTFLSLTLEPTVDTVPVLREYAARYGADRPRPGLADWFFLTGAAGDVDALRRSLGFYDLDPRVDTDITRHASLLLCGNSTADRWAAFPADLARADQVRTVRRMAGFTFEQRYGIRG